MESEDNFSDTVIKTRSALTDMTNRPLKRQNSSISGDVGVENLLKKKCLNINRDDKGKNLCVELPLSGNNSSQEPSLPSGGTDDSNDSFVGFSQKSQGGSLNYDFLDRAFERHDDRENSALDNLGLPKCAGIAVEPSTVSGSKFPGLERCTGLKSHAGENSDAHVGGDASVELLKNCTCSFCSKGIFTLKLLCLFLCF